MFKDKMPICKFIYNSKNRGGGYIIKQALKAYFIFVISSAFGVSPIP